MRLPSLKHYPATSMRRMPPNKDTWSRFLKNHHESDHEHLLISTHGPVAVFVPVALMGDLKKLKAQFIGLRIGWCDLDQAEAFEFVADPKPLHVARVHNRLGAKLLGLVVPAELVGLFA